MDVSEQMNESVNMSVHEGMRVRLLVDNHTYTTPAGVLLFSAKCVSKHLTLMATRVGSASFSRNVVPEYTSPNAP